MVVNRIIFTPVPDNTKRCRFLYISPIKTLAVDVERNLRAPLVGIAHIDEIHAIVTTKRGSHLALSLERLEYLFGGLKN